MAYILGGAFGYWVLYALFALIFRHKVGFIIASVMVWGTSIIQLAVNGEYRSLISAIIWTLCVLLIKQIQVRKSEY